MEKTKIKIHIETEKLFFDNTNSDESIYNFFIAQQYQTKKYRT